MTRKAMEQPGVKLLMIHSENAATSSFVRELSCGRGGAVPVAVMVVSAERERLASEIKRSIIWRNFEA